MIEIDQYWRGVGEHADDVEMSLREHGIATRYIGGDCYTCLIPDEYEDCFLMVELEQIQACKVVSKMEWNTYTFTQLHKMDFGNVLLHIYENQDIGEVLDLSEADKVELSELSIEPTLQKERKAKRKTKPKLTQELLDQCIALIRRRNLGAVQFFRGCLPCDNCRI